VEEHNTIVVPITGEAITVPVKVDYHGSRLEKHGEWTLIGYDENNPGRFMLSRGHDILTQVARTSFTILEIG
jgi:hypothetical protein